MKKFLSPLFIILVCLISASAWGQSKESLVGRNLKSFEGLWEYTDATDTFRIMLVLAVDTVRDSRQPVDCLYGLHYFKHNGEVVFDYLYNTGAVAPRKASVWASNALPEKMRNPNGYRLFTIAVLDKDFDGSGELILKGSKKKRKLVWDIKEWYNEENVKNMPPKYQEMVAKSAVLTKKLTLHKVAVPEGYANPLFKNMPAFGMSYNVNVFTPYNYGFFPYWW